MTTFSWGNNAFGQLGNGTNINSNVPVTVSDSVNFIDITGGIFHSLSILSDGLVNAWGANYSGQLGDGTLIDSNIPETVIALINATEVAAGVFHSIALLSNGTVRAWGDNFVGQLGNGTFNSSTAPVSVIGLTNATSVISGLNHNLALLRDGTIRAWGGNFFGQLGNGTNITSNVPVTVLSLRNVVAISAGGGHSLALLNNGTVYAWGQNSNGELGDGTNQDRSIPVQVKGIGGFGVPNNVIAISAGEFHSLALLNNGTVLSWGSNEYGQLGDGTNIDSNVPVQVKGTGGASILNNIAIIAAGGFHSLVLQNDGTALAWGENESGQLGDGSYLDSDIPVFVSGLMNSNTIAGGGDHSLDIQLPPTPPPTPPPTIICPADIIQLNDPGSNGAIVDFPPPLVFDQCPDGFTVFCTPPSGSFFPMGTTTVTCTVMDQCGGFATCSFNVTVKEFIVECFLSDSKGNPLNPLDEGSISCSEIGVRKDVTVSLSNGELITLQEVNILKSGFIVVQVISRKMTKKTLPIPFHVIETLLLCAPVGTSVHCNITDFVCQARLIFDTNSNFQQLDLTIIICQSVNTEAEVKLEVKGKPCVPRKEITTSFSEPISNFVEGVPTVHCIRTLKVYDWMITSVNIKQRLSSDQVKFIC